MNIKLFIALGVFFSFAIESAYEKEKRRHFLKRYTRELLREHMEGVDIDFEEDDEEEIIEEEVAEQDELILEEIDSEGYSMCSCSEYTYFSDTDSVPEITVDLPSDSDSEYDEVIG